MSDKEFIVYFIIICISSMVVLISILLVICKTGILKILPKTNEHVWRGQKIAAYWLMVPVSLIFLTVILLLVVSIITSP